MRKVLVITLLLASFAAFAQVPNIELTVNAPPVLNPSNEATWLVRITNHNTTPSGDLTVNFTSFTRSPMSVTRVSLPPACAVTELDRVECTVNVPPVSSVELPLVIQYDRPYGYVTFYAFVNGLAASASFLFPHEYPVTTTADSGPGSLRQAILDLNRDCSAHTEPCGPAFRIAGPVPEEGWFTIRPLSPLPEITAGFPVFDGKTQSRLTGETNGERGPEVMLDGSSAGPTNGLRFHGYQVIVSDLAIGNFNGNGIEADPAFMTTIRTAYLGLHPSGFRGAPNAGRGIQVNRGEVEISDSYLSANGRAGAYLTGSTGNVHHSFIGVGVDGVTPLGNGASGLFFQKYGLSWEQQGAWDNVIANNAHAGIGFTTDVIGDFGRNTFRDNAGRAIDVEMDGTTLEPRIGYPGRGGIIGAPVIDSAHYENGITTISGHLRSRSAAYLVSDVVYVYANTAGKEAGDLIGIASADRENLLFTLRVERDLRGQFVSASEFVYMIYLWDDPAPGTSEIGPPQPVQ
jgi:hypothetical protein